MQGVAYHRRYPSEVVRDRGDGTWDVMPLDEPLRGQGLQAVPERVGLPSAASSRVRPGTRCLVGFVDGDRRAPRIEAWEFAEDSGTVSLDGGIAGVARKGDLVRVLAGAAVPIVGIVNGTLTAPNGATTPVVNQPFDGTAFPDGPIHAEIIGGARRVKA